MYTTRPTILTALVAFLVAISLISPAYAVAVERRPENEIEKRGCRLFACRIADNSPELESRVSQAYASRTHSLATATALPEVTISFSSAVALSTSTPVAEPTPAVATAPTVLQNLNSNTNDAAGQSTAMTLVAAMAAASVLMLL